MGRPAKLRIWWSDSLYGADLQDRIDSLLAPGTDLVAIGNTVSGCKWAGAIRTANNWQGPEQVRRTPRGVRLLPARRTQPWLLSDLPTSEHHYRTCVYEGEEIGLHWRVLLHREIVFVLAAASSERKVKRRLEQFGVAILPRPKSAHDMIEIPSRLGRIAAEAQDLLTFIWKDGVSLWDWDGILPGGKILLRTPEPENNPA